MEYTYYRMNWKTTGNFIIRPIFAPGLANPGTVSMGHATWEHFWKRRGEQSKAFGIIRRLLQLAKSLNPDLGKVYGALWRG